MTAKPLIRVKAGEYAYTADSFQNATQRMGLGAGGALDGAGYAPNFLSQRPFLLESAYSTSWIVGKAVDAPAEDMTKAGIVLNSTLDPEQAAQMYAAYDDLILGQGMADGIRWGRLYGGAINLMMIDGQDVSTPLNLDSIGQGQFRGLRTFDRWVAYPDLTELVSEQGPDWGLPKFYIVEPNISLGVEKRLKIHYSRVQRFVGNPIPWRRKMIENLWGASICERLWDRLLAFDSASAGAAQLVYKAHLRTVKVKDYRNLIAAGGKMFDAVIAQFEHMRRFQTIEGLTVMDMEDEFEAHSYSFAGLDDILTQFGDQVCGAIEVPRVRMFGESPGGLNSDGESAMRTYYDDTAKKQNTTLRRPTQLVLDVLARSVLGAAPPEGFGFSFAPLGQMTAEAKAEVAKVTTEAVAAAYDSGMITAQVAAKELRESSRTTGIFTNITDEDIDAMEDEIPDPIETAEAMAKATAVDDASQPGGAPKKPAKAA